MVLNHRLWKMDHLHRLRKMDHQVSFIQNEEYPVYTAESSPLHYPVYTADSSPLHFCQRLTGNTAVVAAGAALGALAAAATAIVSASLLRRWYVSFTKIQIILTVRSYLQTYLTCLDDRGI